MGDLSGLSGDDCPACWERLEMTVSKAVVDVLAATPLQEGLLALHRLSSGRRTRTHVQFVFRIDGNLDEALLARCADAMLVRYPNLRVAFYDKNVEHPRAGGPRLGKARLGGGADDRYQLARCCH